jgi:hypothetical protein
MMRSEVRRLRYVTFNAIQQTEQSVALAAAGEEVSKPV